FSHLISFALISFVVALVCMFLSQPISFLLYGSRGDAFIQSVSYQMRFLFMAIPAAVIATVLGSYQYAHKNFIRFPIAQLIGSVLNVTIIFFLSSYIGIWALIMGFVANIITQIFFIF